MKNRDAPARSRRPRKIGESEVAMTNGRPLRLADLTFVPFGDGSERATIDGGEVMRESGRYWIMTVNGPQWFDIDEREVDPALNFLVFKKRQQQEQSSQ
jgi:hypothetical protein